MTRTPRALLLCGLALAAHAPPASAQFGRLKNMVAGVDKGKVYGLDVSRVSSVVFVVDLTPIVELPPGAVENLKQLAAERGEAYVRQKLAAEGSDWALRAAGPAGMVVKEALARRGDRAERARNHVRAAIEGLREDQRFGLVTFEAGPRSWRDSAVEASKSNREDAREFLSGLQKVEGDGFLRSALLAAAGLPAEQPAQGSAADVAAMQAAMAGAATDPQAQAALVAAMENDPQLRATVAAAAAQTPSSGGGSVPGPVPAGSPGQPLSAKSLVRGVELALESEPETIVIVVAAAPATDTATFVAGIEQLVDGRPVTIHVAVFGEQQPGGALAALAEANGGVLLTENEGQE